jgi:hypothetical protein
MTHLYSLYKNVFFLVHNRKTTNINPSSMENAVSSLMIMKSNCLLSRNITMNTFYIFSITDASLSIKTEQCKDMIILLTQLDGTRDELECGMRCEAGSNIDERANISTIEYGTFSRKTCFRAVDFDYLFLSIQ